MKLITMSRNRCRALTLTLGLLVVGSGRFAAGQQSVDPAKVIGRDTCKICHQSEFAAWEHSSHNTKAWGLLDHPKAAGFAKALGVSNIKGASACTQCHGTQQARGGQMVVAKGNSCESCHGGAGGNGGWFRVHFDFGLGRQVTRNTKMADLLQDRVQERQQHRAARDAACKQRGMHRSADAYQLARNCLLCHLVPNEKLVEAGHPMSTRFELVEWLQGEVRHNFLLNPGVNAEAPTNWTDPRRNGAGRTVPGRQRLLYVVGQLADLEVSLRSRAGVASTKRGTLGDEANDRILDIQEELEEFEIDELKAVLSAIKDLDKKSLRAITSNDKQIYTQAADSVAQAAQAFVQAHPDGNKLPAAIKTPRKVKGEAYKP